MNDKTMATVDPTTGLGCNSAIQTSQFFKDFITNIESGSLSSLIEAYRSEVKGEIRSIHQQSRVSRALYRPDTIPQGSS